MTTTKPNPHERIARKMLTQRPLLVGVDDEGGIHYWDSYEFAVAVVAADLNGEKIELAETPFETLAGWCEYTRSERGWDSGPNVGGSLVDDLAAAMEVSA